MATRGLSINFSRLSVLASGAVVSASYPTPNGTTIFEGLEMDGRDLSVAGIEVGIDNNQKIILNKDIEFTAMIAGDDVLSGTDVNVPSDASPSKSVVVMHGDIGELYVAIEEVYVFAVEDFGGDQLRCMLTFRIRRGTAITTGTVTA